MTHPATELRGGGKVVIAAAALTFLTRRQARESRSAMTNNGKAPERPRVEPEIIPPDRTRSAPRGAPYFETSGTHRVYVTRIGPLGGVLLMLALALFVAVGGLLFVGALLISIPLVAFLIIVGVIAGLWRS